MFSRKDFNQELGTCWKEGEEHTAIIWELVRASSQLASRSF